jgi:hypothetical protein
MLPTVAAAGGAAAARGAPAAAGVRGAFCATATHAATAVIITAVAAIRHLDWLIRNSPFVAATLTLPCAVH